MDDTQIQLLDRHSVLILPEEIEHSTFVLLLEALLHLDGKPLVLHCHGNGGISAVSRAMVDLIRQAGNVTGLMAGECNSSHGIVWASCQQRFVYPHGILGVHRVAKSQVSTRFDGQTFEQFAADFNRMDMENSHILASASNKPSDWWYERIVETGSGGTTNFTATQLVLMDMAKPISEYRPPDPAGLTVSPAVLPSVHTDKSDNGYFPFGLT